MTKHRVEQARDLRAFVEALLHGHALVPRSLEVFGPLPDAPRGDAVIVKSATIGGLLLRPTRGHAGGGGGPRKAGQSSQCTAGLRHKHLCTDSAEKTSFFSFHLLPTLRGVAMRSQLCGAHIVRDVRAVRAQSDRTRRQRVAMPEKRRRLVLAPHDQCDVVREVGAKDHRQVTPVSHQVMCEWT